MRWDGGQRSWHVLFSDANLVEVWQHSGGTWGASLAGQGLSWLVSYVSTARVLNPATLMLDSRVLCNQQLNERMQQRFASLSDVVNKLEETQVKREFLL
jgi:hypothetical protein